jgi:hypothetical protein
MFFSIKLLRDFFLSPIYYSLSLGYLAIMLSVGKLRDMELKSKV